MTAVERVVGAGATRVVLGTAAIRDPDFAGQVVERFGEGRVAVALDTRGGTPVVDGWVEAVGTGSAADALRTLAATGVTTFEVTAVERDGMLVGPDLDLLRRLVRIGHVRVIEVLVRDLYLARGVVLFPDLRHVFAEQHERLAPWRAEIAPAASWIAGEEPKNRGVRGGFERLVPVRHQSGARLGNRRTNVGASLGSPAPLGPPPEPRLARPRFAATDSHGRMDHPRTSSTRRVNARLTRPDPPANRSGPAKPRQTRSSTCGADPPGDV